MEGRPVSAPSLTPKRSLRHRWWPRVLLGGLIIWALSLLTYWATKDSTIIPSIIFSGSFLIPITFVVWAVEREQYSGANPAGQPSALTVPLLITAIVGAGLFAVVLCALIESLLLPGHPVAYYPGIAVIEETVKLLMVFLLARHLRTYYLRDGMVLGASVGFGFAAFESSGYAFNALIAATNNDLFPLLQDQLVRGLLAPVGHGLWTALAGGALFAAARHGRMRLAPSVFGWWLVAVLLHLMWDVSAGLAIALTYLSTGEPIDRTAVELGRLTDPSQAQVHFDVAYYWLLYSTCAVIGILLAQRMWSKGRAVLPGFTGEPDGLESLT
ncbi:MAG: PrsW family glutamic-type intramembrane protease [Actinomycetes bacterium]